MNFSAASKNGNLTGRIVAEIHFFEHELNIEKRIRFQILFSGTIVF